MAKPYAYPMLQNSIPFVWQELRWDSGWGTYQGESITGNSIVDGGVLSNFPLHLLTSSDESALDAGHARLF